MFQQALGVDVSTMRLMIAIAGVSMLVLYLYRLYAIIHCMSRVPSDFPSPVDRAVWSGLSAFMPLGIGALLYHAVSSKSMLALVYFIPFFGVSVPAVYMLLKVCPNITNFNFNFLGM
jgi:hypothetical protein